ncbi:MAG: metallophosphoesterase [Phycisphaerae bacterium]|nr:metallophosphoesterase [Phycisphaerae bacterium]
MNRHCWVILATAACLAVADYAQCEESTLPPVAKGSTTLAILPDTERYSDDYPQYFEAQTKWIAENHKTRNIAYAVHLGDITQHNAPAEWEVARKCFTMLDGLVPYVLTLGNHDYDDNAPKRDTSLVTKYFPLTKVRKWPTFGGVYKKDKLDNSYHLLSIGKQKWIIVSLECGPRNEVVAWANKVLNDNADRLAIFVTHAYLFRNNVRYDHTKGKQRASPHGWGNDGQELWDKLVRKHRNMMIVLSGHVSTGGLGYLASKGDHGNTVHQMMVDYEKMRGGGKAYMRLLEFLPDNKTVQVRTYSPATKQTKNSKLEEFTFKLKPADRKSPKRAATTPGAVPGRSAGGVARPARHELLDRSSHRGPSITAVGKLDEQMPRQVRLVNPAISTVSVNMVRPLRPQLPIRSVWAYGQQ